MASLLVSGEMRPSNAPADIGVARESLYGCFLLWMWTRGFGPMEEIEADLREGRLGDSFRQWLQTRGQRRR